MPAAPNKTKKTEASVDAFINTVSDEQKRADAFALLDLMQTATKQPAKMWGTAIVGFGDIHYASQSGREGDWFLIGLSPRVASLTLYAVGGWARYPELLKDLGKHKLSGGCLHIKRLSDVNPPVLKQIIQASVKYSKETAKETYRPASKKPLSKKKK